MIGFQNQHLLGGKKWDFSDEIYKDLTGKEVSSEYNPLIPVIIKKLPNLSTEKNIFGIFWGTPTFKSIDCNYLIHVHDKNEIDYIISTSSGNTVEGLARAIRTHNINSINKMKAILLVPELSSFKVAKSAIENNPDVQYIVLKNSTLDSIRNVAGELIHKLSEKYNVASANADLKTAAYAQIGLILNEYGLMNNDSCFVQTVSGGVGPTGFIEAANKLKVKPEILLVQPTNGKSAPIIDALKGHNAGDDPIALIEQGNYETSHIETTLGSSKPLYAMKKFIKWRKKGYRIFGVSVTEKELLSNKEQILEILVKAEIYPNIEIASKFYEIEKSGIIAFTGVLNSIEKIQSNNIIINYTGRYLDPISSVPIPATPHLIYDPSDGIDRLLTELKLD